LVVLRLVLVVYFAGVCLYVSLLLFVYL